MKLVRIFIFFSSIIFLSTCITYDKAIIYHKDFLSGSNSLLRFDGFYTDSILSLLEPDDARDRELVKPVFFYSNGSVFSTNNNTQNSSLDDFIKTKRLNGSWGNYLISSDTIQLEKFQLIENNYVRIILRGIISKNQIHWMSRKYHREDFKPVDYTIYFRPFASKPDSTQNFTRTLEIYNKK